MRSYSLVQGTVSNLLGLEYDGRQYKLHRIEGHVFESEPLLINPAEKVVAITIGNRSIENEIEISAGAVEDDPFAF